MIHQFVTDREVWVQCESNAVLCLVVYVKANYRTDRVMR